MGKLMCIINIGQVQVYQISIYFFGIVSDESVLLVAFVQVEVLLE
jgi:hypothetical protein